jgi:hypothetical protein
MIRVVGVRRRVVVRGFARFSWQCVGVVYLIPIYIVVQLDI